MPAKYKAFLGLGGNLGDRAALLDRAEALLSERAGQVLAVSERIETAPEGFVSEHPFLNEALVLETVLDPMELLHVTEDTERQLGRVRKSADGRYSDRTMDIDLLLLGDRVIQTPRLTVPHPRLPLRRFALEPLAQIAPNALHPLLGRTIRQLLDELDAAGTRSF